MPLTLDGLAALLDPKNPMSEELVRDFKFMEDNVGLIAERKGKNLVEVIQQLKAKRLCPVVDKKLKLVLGVDGGHDLVCSKLFDYHYYADDPELIKPHVGLFGARDRYVIEKHGYFISSMRPNIIVVGFGYRPDIFDKDLFLVHEFQHF